MLRAEEALLRLNNGFDFTAPEEVLLIDDSSDDNESNEVFPLAETSQAHPMVSEINNSFKYDHKKQELKKAMNACRNFDIPRLNHECLSGAISFASDSPSSKLGLADKQGLSTPKLSDSIQASNFFCGSSEL